MQSKCPYCENAIAPGAIVCQKCGSYLVKVEDKKRTWPYIAGAIAIIAVPLLIFVVLQRIEESKSSNPPPSAQKVSSEKKKQVAQKKAKKSLTRSRTKEKLKRRKREDARKQAREEWLRRPEPEKMKYLDEQLPRTRVRFETMRTELQQREDQEGLDLLARNEHRLEVAETTLNVGEYDRVWEEKRALDRILNQVSERLELQEREARLSMEIQRTSKALQAEDAWKEWSLLEPGDQAEACSQQLEDLEVRMTMIETMVFDSDNERLATGYRDLSHLRETATSKIEAGEYDVSRAALHRPKPSSATRSVEVQGKPRPWRPRCLWGSHTPV